MITRRFVVRGRVQGVGFRWFVARQATTLGLVGFARNRDDGSVEVVAQGPAAAIESLAQALTQGPALARVTAVENTDFPHDVSSFSSFDTR